MTEIRVVYTKYDGSLHWNLSARRLGEDEHGVWVGCPAGTTMSKGTKSTVVLEHAAVLLFPPGAWWTAMFNAEPHDAFVYCDITSIPEWRDGMVTMVDLDLDVIRFRDGRMKLDDEDEFAEHQVQYRYPPDVIHRAEQTAASLMKDVERGVEPFGTTPAQWMAELL